MARRGTDQGQNDAKMPSPRLPELRPPNPESWQRAVAYRVNPSSRKTTAKKIERHRKKKCSESDDASVECDLQGSRLAGKGSGSQDIDIYPEDDEAVLQDDAEEAFISPGNTDEYLYSVACKRLGIVPAAGVVRCLETDELILKNRALGPKGAYACTIVLANNVNVRKLDLGGNDIVNEGAFHVANMLKENSTIAELHLGGNCIETEGIRVLCSVLKDCGRVNVLDLSGNNLQDRDARYISDMLEENRTIRELCLAHNAFAEKAGEYLAVGLANNDALELLDLSWNHLRLHGAAALVLSLQEESSISTLNLSWNGLHVEGCKALGDVLATTTTITYLDVSSNRINSTALKVLLEGLKKNCSLITLKVANNPLTTEGAMTVLQVLQERGDDLPIKELDFGDLCVDAAFVKQLKMVRQKRILSVKHGLILKTDDLGFRAHSDPFDLDDPMMVLMEFMRIRNLKLDDLFSNLAQDGEKSISREQFKTGLRSVNIPLSAHALDELIDRLDSNGDGAVDFGELLEGQKEHKRNIKRLLSRAGHGRFFDNKTDLGRINTKIRALMAMTSVAARTRHRNNPVMLTDVVSAMAGHLLANRAAGGNSLLNHDNDEQAKISPPLSPRQQPE